MGAKKHGDTIDNPKVEKMMIALTALSGVFVVLSSISSTICVGDSFLEILMQVLPEWKNTYVVIALYAIAMVINTAVDVLGINWVGGFALVELFAFLDGRFYMSRLSRLIMASCLAILLACFWFSFETSKSGASPDGIISSGSGAIKLPYASEDAIRTQEDQRLSERLQPYEDALKRAEEEQDRAVQNAVAPFKEGHEKGGSEYHTRNYLAAQKKATNATAKAITDAKKELREMRAKYESEANASIASKKKELEEAKTKKAIKENKIQTTIAQLGVWPQIIMLFILFIQCGLAVRAQEPVSSEEEKEEYEHQLRLIKMRRKGGSKFFGAIKNLITLNGDSREAARATVSVMRQKKEEGKK